jgi:hypothetical protein
MTAAQNAAMGVAGTPTSSLMSQYENPYQAGVVNEINRLGQQQFQETLAPGAVSGAVGSGQFGSRRGMEVYGDVARDVNKNILGLQTSALQSGYDKALAAAQQQQKLGLDTATTLGNISGQQYTQGVGGINVLSGLGAQQQATEQARLNYPMTAATQQAALLKGYTVPTSITQKYTGPMPGAYNTSPLAQVAGLTTGAASLFGTPKEGKSAFQNITGYETLGGAATAGFNWLKNAIASTPATVGDPKVGDIAAKVDSGGQPTSEDLAYLAGKYGITFDNVPVAKVSPPPPSNGLPFTDPQGPSTPDVPLPPTDSSQFTAPDYADQYDYSTYDPNNPDWGTM